MRFHYFWKNKSITKTLYMKFFNFNKKKEPFHIQDDDKNWVEDNFNWLIEVYGYPNSGFTQFLLNERYFPLTFSTKILDTQYLINDLCQLFNINPKKIQFEFVRDTPNYIPYEKYENGDIFQIDTHQIGDRYKIIIAEDMMHYHKRYIFNLLFEFIKIRLSENKLEYDNEIDTQAFIHIAGIFFGFGVIISQNSKDIGAFEDGESVKSWNFTTELSEEVMAYALALHTKLINNDNPDWKKELSSELSAQFERAMIYLNENSSPLFNQNELESNNLFLKSYDAYEKKNYTLANSILENILEKSKDDFLKADVYNNIGYNLIRNCEFEKSISYFEKSIALKPGYGHAYNNLGYVFVRIGKVEEGKYLLDQALQSLNNDPAYTYRNLALYYQAKKEYTLAEKNFKLALEKQEHPVDLLPFHYGEFLIEIGQIDEGRKYLQMDVDKGEIEAISSFKKYS